MLLKPKKSEHNQRVNECRNDENNNANICEDEETYLDSTTEETEEDNEIELESDDEIIAIKEQTFSLPSETIQYKGIITNCTVYKRDLRQRLAVTISLTVSNKELEYVTFVDIINTNLLIKAIVEKYGKLVPRKLIGNTIIFRVKNSTSWDGTKFSNITECKFK